MKKEIKSNRLITRIVTTDGGSGEIHMPTWIGSVIWSYDAGWEHVSVAPYKKNIMPSWDDMCKIKDIFWDEDETVVQYHPAKEDYVNNVANCLHLWKPINQKIPKPNKLLVGRPDNMSMAEFSQEYNKILKECKL